MHWWLDLMDVPFSFGFLPGSFIGVSFGLPPWLAPLEVLLGVLLFWIYRLWSSMLPCVHALILLKGLKVMDSVVHRLDLVWRDKLHPWKTSVVYETFWAGVILCLVFFLLLSWGCILCDTCSVPFLVLFYIHILHVAPTIHNYLVCYA